MRGKYITTTIMLAALSVCKSKPSTDVKEILAATGDHKIIWSKNNQTKTRVFIKKEAALVC